MIDPETVKGRWVRIPVKAPQSVCCDESLMVCALRSVGVRLHPVFGFSKFVEESAGAPVTSFRWVLADRSVCGTYKTEKLIAWWKDAAWMKANPTHEFAIVATALRNMGAQAGEIRGRIARVVVRRGRDEAHIPVTFSPARRQWSIDRLERRIPLNTPFEEPHSASSGPAAVL